MAHFARFLVVIYFVLHKTLGSDDLQSIQQLLSSTKYDSHKLPTNHLNVTTVVNVRFFVKSFTSPNPITMNYKADLDIRLGWVDTRLESESLTRPVDLSKSDLITKVWKPDVFFPNAASHSQFTSEDHALIRVTPKSSAVLQLSRVQASFSCSMNLAKFPMDKQMCTMSFASSSRTVDELILQWNEDTPVKMENIELTQFKMTKVVATTCSVAIQPDLGNYSCLTVEFYMDRLLGYHLVNSYLPTILMVVISFVVFWIDPAEISGRLMMGITTLLTITAKTSNIQENVETSYVKAIDIWMLTCSAVVFLVLMECMTVHFMWVSTDKELEDRIPRCFWKYVQGFNKSSKEGGPVRERKVRHGKELGSSENLKFQEFSSENNGKITPGKLFAKKMDAVSSALLPLAFFIFVLLYWVCYLYG